MKLGLCYMVFTGEELLEFAARSVREQVDYISATYQSTSYYGDVADPGLLPILERVVGLGLVDELVYYEPDLSLHPKDNELKLRNLGLEVSRRAGCTHHISSDVDEFYTGDQLRYAKEAMDGQDYDFSIAYLATYYKDPTFRVVPDQNVTVSFIHPVNNEYRRLKEFPFTIESTRRLVRNEKYRVFSRDELTVHHMSYVRRDLRKKIANTINGLRIGEDFFATFDEYTIGGRVCLPPDYLNRRTVVVDNIFGIGW